MKLYSNRAIQLALLFLLSQNIAFASSDGEVFHNQWNETRVYYKDWLTVCKKRGEDTCRMVTYAGKKEPSGFSTSSLTLFPAQAGKPAFIEFFDRGAPSPPLRGITIQIDDRQFHLSNKETLQKTTPLGDKILETYAINSAKVEKIITAMRDGRWLFLTYDRGNQVKTIRFSLLGVTHSAAFIQAIKEQ
ncbi:hypothetical protein [Amphritea sp. HPY]|uniref:hypothetical protein n=1 Tax=Amphritea sp. HPY TaxID=3421652 RepID=UPI003D7CEB2F